MGSVNVEPESDSEYEEWMPAVIERWAMCVGKGDMSYLPAELREKILSC